MFIIIIIIIVLILWRNYILYISTVVASDDDTCPTPDICTIPVRHLSDTCPNCNDTKESYAYYSLGIESR
jgi:hypothetical protein